VGLIIPTAPVPPDAWPEASKAGTEYVELGWADRYYNLSASAEWHRRCVALLLPTRSILKVIPIDSHPAEYCTGNGLVQVPLSPDGFQRICEFVGRTYARDADGRPTFLAAERGCRIYAARGRYFFPRTSNAWTARALREAGCPISPARCATAGPTFRRAAMLGTVIREDRSVGDQLREIESGGLPFRP